jgi:hypothetical protein
MSVRSHFIKYSVHISTFVKVFLTINYRWTETSFIRIIVKKINKLNRTFISFTSKNKLLPQRFLLRDDLEEINWGEGGIGCTWRTPFTRYRPVLMDGPLQHLFVDRRQSTGNSMGLARWGWTRCRGRLLRRLGARVCCKGGTWPQTVDSEAN